MGFLQEIIPASNTLSMAFSTLADLPGAKAQLFEHAYGSGFVGAFIDDTDQLDWARRSARYLKDEFFADTPGRKQSFSDVESELPKGDGECHQNHRWAMEAWKATGRGVEPCTLQQDYGSCVDASGAEIDSLMIGYRAGHPEQFREEWRNSCAWYSYANRGYCSDGWSGYGRATVVKRLGVAFRQQYTINENTVDFTDDDRNENIVARQWCRTGVPSWMAGFTAANHAYEDGAVTEFDGGMDGLKKLFKAGGALHFSGTRQSGGSKPFTPGSVGPHMMAAYGYDDSEQFRRFCQDVIGVPARANDFPLHCGQTWGSGWSGECADKYWPSWWGPKTQGSWICWASWFLKSLSPDISYLPRVKGFPATNPTPPTVPEITGRLRAEPYHTGIAIRGEIKSGGFDYIAVPDGTGLYKIIPKPVL